MEHKHKYDAQGKQLCCTQEEKIKTKSSRSKMDLMSFQNKISKIQRKIDSLLMIVKNSEASLFQMGIPSHQCQVCIHHFCQEGV